jgi:hypothetical protein
MAGTRAAHTRRGWRPQTADCRPLRAERPGRLPIRSRRRANVNRSGRLRAERQPIRRYGTRGARVQTRRLAVGHDGVVIFLAAEDEDLVLSPDQVARIKYRTGPGHPHQDRIDAGPAGRIGVNQTRHLVYVAPDDIRARFQGLNVGAPVDQVKAAGDEQALVGGQEQRQVGDVVGRANRPISVVRSQHGGDRALRQVPEPNDPNGRNRTPCKGAGRSSRQPSPAVRGTSGRTRCDPSVDVGETTSRRAGGDGRVARSSRISGFVPNPGRPLRTYP